jgi:DNA-binding helix-hairpin-helix protein with protein kinase domain
MIRPPTWSEALHEALDALATCRHTKGQIPCGRFDCPRCRGRKPVPVPSTEENDR